MNVFLSYSAMAICNFVETMIAGSWMTNHHDQESDCSKELLISSSRSSLDSNTLGKRAKDDSEDFELLQTVPRRSHFTILTAIVTGVNIALCIGSFIFWHRRSWLYMSDKNLQKQSSFYCESLSTLLAQPTNKIADIQTILTANQHHSWTLLMSALELFG